MKTKFLMVALLAMGLVAMTTSCDDDNYTPEDIYVQAFQQLYPEASRVEWEDKQGYKVADFRYQNKETEAWFDQSAKWMMTETDLLYTDLPAAIRTAFEASQYATWRVDDVDKLERVDTETIYVIEVESGKQEYDLYYAEDGTLIKTVQDGNNKEHQPLTISQAIMDKIRELYPGTTAFLEFDREGNYTEIEFKDGNTYKEALFDSNSAWVCTMWDIRRTDVPTVVMNALNASEYGSYKMDDVEIFHSPAGLFYLFEMEKGDKDYYCMFSENGTQAEVPAVAYR